MFRWFDIIDHFVLLASCFGFSLCFVSVRRERERMLTFFFFSSNDLQYFPKILVCFCVFGVFRHSNARFVHFVPSVRSFCLCSPDTWHPPPPCEIGEEKVLGEKPKTQEDEKTGLTPILTHFYNCTQVSRTNCLELVYGRIFFPTDFREMTASNCVAWHIFFQF